MIWYKNLYVGERIGRGAARVKWKIRHNAGQISIYVIALASNEKNLLDIIPAQELLQKSYPKKKLYVVGLAKGYDEAIETAASIVMDVYRKTGTFTVRDYILSESRMGNS